MGHPTFELKCGCSNDLVYNTLRKGPESCLLACSEHWTQIAFRKPFSTICRERGRNMRKALEQQELHIEESSSSI